MKFHNWVLSAIAIPFLVSCATGRPAAREVEPTGLRATDVPPEILGDPALTPDVVLAGLEPEGQDLQRDARARDAAARDPRLDRDPRYPARETYNPDARDERARVEDPDWAMDSPFVYVMWRTQPAGDMADVGMGFRYLTSVDRDGWWALRFGPEIHVMGFQSDLFSDSHTETDDGEAMGMGFYMGPQFRFVNHPDIRVHVFGEAFADMTWGDRMGGTRKTIGDTGGFGARPGIGIEFRLFKRLDVRLEGFTQWTSQDYKIFGEPGTTGVRRVEDPFSYGGMLGFGIRI
jgi:hypothetical protein